MSDLFIVDIDDKNRKAKNYLHEWADLAHTFDVATEYCVKVEQVTGS